MSDGILSIKKRRIKMQEIYQKKENQKQLERRTYRYYLKGKTSQISKDDFIIEKERRIRLKDYEKFLKRFQYKQALDATLKEVIYFL